MEDDATVSGIDKKHLWEMADYLPHFTKNFKYNIFKIFYNFQLIKFLQQRYKDKQIANRVSCQRHTGKKIQKSGFSNIVKAYETFDDTADGFDKNSQIDQNDSNLKLFE